MAKKRPEEKVSATPTPTKMVQIVNLTSDRRDITMPDGTNVGLLAFRRGGEGFTSQPLDYDRLPAKFQEILQKMVKRREIKIVEV